MRAIEFLSESAAKELADKLPTLKRTDYNAIDELMQRVSTHHGIDGKKLHDLFVAKYKDTPDTWVKKIKQRNEDTVNEANPRQQAALYNPNGTTYRGSYNKMPTLGDNPFDIYTKGKAQSLDTLGDQPSDEPEMDDSIKRLIKSRIDLLTGKQRQMIHMHYWQDMSTREIAQKLGYSAPYITHVIAAGLRKLKTATPEYDPESLRQYSGINEGVETTEDQQKIKDFIQWSLKTLNMQQPHPKFEFSRDTEQAQKDHRTGMHTSDGNILVYIENRNLVDIFRTIFHELVHHRQDQLNMIGPDDSYPGSPVEAMADMMAGKYIKIYGKQHPEIFQ